MCLNLGWLVNSTIVGRRKIWFPDVKCSHKFVRLNLNNALTEETHRELFVSIHISSNVLWTKTSDSRNH